MEIAVSEHATHVRAFSYSTRYHHANTVIQCLGSGGGGGCFGRVCFLVHMLKAYFMDINLEFILLFL